MSSAQASAPQAAAPAAEAGELVQLFIYDLSGGLARTFSQMLLGRQIEAIFHTSVVVGGLEHFFGGGINVAPAGTTPFGRPIQVLPLGYTQLPEELRSELLAELSERYTPEAYSLFSNNCNHFSAELAQLLCGADIPAHITGLPQEVLATPFGQMIAPMLTGLEQQLRGMRGQAVRPAGGGAGAAAATPLAPLAEAAQLEAAAPQEPREPAAEPAAAAATAAAQPQERAPAAAAPPPDEAPALHAAEVEIEAAVAAGMMQEAEEQLGQLGLAQGPAVGAEPGQAAAPAPEPGVAAPAAAAAQPAAPSGEAGAAAAGAAASAAKLAAELEVAREFRRLMAVGGLSKHEAQAAAVEAVAARRAAGAAGGGA